MATLIRDDLDLRYEVTGAGPALLLPAFNFRWGDYLDVGLLTGRFTVVTASPRGFGASGVSTTAPRSFYRELSELPPNFLIDDVPCPLFTFWG